MTFRVYTCGYLSHAKERAQMDDLRVFLEKHFTHTAEDVRLVVDPRPDCQIDGLVFKDGKLIILELKNVGGRIIADFDPSKPWRLLEPGGREVFLEQENPLSQLRRYRQRLLRFFWQGVLRRHDDIPDEFRDAVSGWVVVRQGSDISRVNVWPSNTYWLSVLPSDAVSQALVLERGGLAQVTVEQFDLLLELLHAEERPTGGWMRPGALVEVSSVAPVKVPVVDFLLTSADADRVLTGLRYTQELELKQHEAEVRGLLAHRDEGVRMSAAKLLVAWESPDLCDTLGRLLGDERPRLRDYALEVLQERPCPSLSPDLTPLLLDSDRNLANLALGAVVSSGGETACRIVGDYARRQSVEEHLKDILAEGRLESAGIPFASVARALGRLRCADTVPLLLEVLDRLDRSGKRDTNVGVGIAWDEVVLALGSIGDARAFEPLSKELSAVEAGWERSAIRALGFLRDERAVPLLLPFLGSGDDMVVNETVHALTAISSEQAFEALSVRLVHGPPERTAIAIRYPIMKALAAISPRRTEEFALAQLRNPSLSQETAWLMLDLLGPVATEASIEVLFSSMKDRAYSEQAAGILAHQVPKPEVFTRAQQLLLSSNEPPERAGALYIMCRRWGAHLLEELENYEKDHAVEVRRVVAWEYRSLKNATGRHRLLAMAEDQDSTVRRHVYHAFFEEPLAALDRGLLLASEGIFHVGPVLLGEEAVVTGTEETEEESASSEGSSDGQEPVLFVIKASGCERVGILKASGAVGLYLRARESQTTHEWLLIPGQWDDGRLVEREMQQFRLKLLNVANRELGPPEMIGTETDFIRKAVSALVEFADGRSKRRGARSSGD